MKCWMTATLALGLANGCKPDVCAPWKDFELRLESVELCTSAEISGSTKATEEDIVASFAQRGYLRGRSGDGSGSIARQSDASFFKDDSSPTYKLLLTQLKDGRLVLNESQPIPRERFVVEADWQKIERLPVDVAAYLEGLAWVPSAFGPVVPSDAKKKSGTETSAQCTDADLLAADPEIGSRKSRHLVNVDAIGAAPESRRGVPGLLKPIAKEAIGKTATSDLVRTLRELEPILTARVVPAFRVMAYRPPGTASTALRSDKFVDEFVGGEVEISLAVLDLKEHRVICRTI